VTSPCTSKRNPPTSSHQQLLVTVPSSTTFPLRAPVSDCGRTKPNLYSHAQSRHHNKRKFDLADSTGRSRAAKGPPPIDVQYEHSVEDSFLRLAANSMRGSRTVRFVCCLVSSRLGDRRRQMADGRWADRRSFHDRAHSYSKWVAQSPNPLMLKEQVVVPLRVVALRVVADWFNIS